MGLAFLDVVGVDWLEFAADFTAACFFVVLGMAPPFAFLPAVLSFSIFAIGVMRPTHDGPSLPNSAQRHPAKTCKQHAGHCVASEE